VAVGDTLRVDWQDVQVQDATPGAEPTPQTEQRPVATVVGIVSDPAGAWSEIGGAGLATPADATRWGGLASLTDATRTYLVLRAAGASDDDVRAAVHAATTADARVLTRDAAATESIDRNAGDGHMLVAVVLGFAAIALLVAALVIANTFQVLVAQRTGRSRCCGASARARPSCARPCCSRPACSARARRWSGSSRAWASRRARSSRSGTRSSTCRCPRRST
jgi:putative ABC transport system permease protein